jgi:hypoxanthine phosphoribosyltransferase
LEDSVFQSFSHELRGADKPIAVLTYEELERWIHSLQDSLSTEGFTCVIGILRGGAPLALMVSHTIGVPVVFLRYERSNRTVKWDSCLPMPPAGSKVLLCEDIAGSGHTLADCTAFLRGRGLILKTLTAAYDELSRIRPDYGMDAVGYFASFRLSTSIMCRWPHCRTLRATISVWWSCGALNLALGTWTAW